MEKIIVDADFCIKLGNSEKYPFLLEVLSLLADNIYIHAYTNAEVKMPHSAVIQLRQLVDSGQVKVVNEKGLNRAERTIYKMSFNLLSAVMINPHRPNKNKGEVCSLAYAKAAGITIFVTDERDLQPIIDSRLNIGINDIQCLRIVDIIKMARDGEVSVSRKTAKALWVIAGKNKDDFDKSVWPLECSP